MIFAELKMQLIVRGNRTHVLDVAASANVEVLRAQLAQLEVRLRLFRPKMFKRRSFQGVDAEELNLFCSGAPLEVRKWTLVSTVFLHSRSGRERRLCWLSSFCKSAR